MRGGYRAGAGRKKGFAAKNAEEARKLLSEKLAQEIEPIAEVLIKQAKKGDTRAIKELFDRSWGKAPQALQIGLREKPSHLGNYTSNPRLQLLSDEYNEKVLELLKEE